ncbi:Phosphoserine aminotransferase [Candidatus Annandia adelgestsuga]|uniref:Phosphoserine aminotransferase n=1 Tax=Candidatus Annandia adelgestsuga TaxID=1302411 RepID=A0A3Q9CM08_9ENTR|nr:3-phosphoserine/phosphohydroxythreonine transaminase [Candidatus Annandia adelgestsuga]AZP36163.1 Phosphoserine aminotransferase [Candidatus Annandia adelgestsuga]
MKIIHNFSAGPAILPKSVLKQAKKELNYGIKYGISILEISHRSKEFIKIAEESEKNLRKLLKIPKNYKVLFCQGGARTQFSAIPLNIINKKNIKADYINSGYWSYSAIKEAKKYCIPNIIPVKYFINNKISILPMKKWKINNNSKYIHYCPNETIEGISIKEEPNFKNKIIIADFSSIILSYPINIKKYDIIYASAQKNLGLSGITLIIIKKSIINKKNKYIPSTLNYKIISSNKSMFNTPSIFSWYLSSLVLNWIKNNGGVKKIYKINKQKSNIIYNIIDSNNFYINNINFKNRSIVNITFKLKNKYLNNLFIKESYEAGLMFLKGHYIFGGIRSSIYNAMSFKSVKKLADFMIYFSNRYS